MTDEFLCDVPELHQFIERIKGIVNGEETVSEKLAVIRPYFSKLLADPHWLPDEFRQTPDVGGMGNGVANWLLYRDTEGSLTLSALVLLPGASTPVHDHLAWGLVGLYMGEQTEEVFEYCEPVGRENGHANLQVAETNRLKVGSFYDLLPPTGDIHRVTTTSPEPSISLHLLTNDVGCVLRHRFEPETSKVIPFRSGYTNLDCTDE
jgi:predicted metal-dependent enzyme (double-stranded beta helix superfamily)